MSDQTEKAFMVIEKGEERIEAGPYLIVRVRTNVGAFSLTIDEYGDLNIKADGETPLIVAMKGRRELEIRA